MLKTVSNQASNMIWMAHEPNDSKSSWIQGGFSNNIKHYKAFFLQKAVEMCLKSAGLHSYSPPVNTFWQPADEWAERRPGELGVWGSGSEINVLWLAGESINQALGEQWRATVRDWSVLFGLALWPGPAGSVSVRGSFIYSSYKHSTVGPSSSWDVIHTHNGTSTAGPSCHKRLPQILINAPSQWFYYWIL